MTIWDKSNEQKIAPKSRSYIFASKRKQQEQRERKGNKKDIAETRDSIQSSLELSGFEPGTFRSSVWRSPNWAISATDV